ncbi:MAG: EAL domain-containing protein [Pseudomonadota bacterium]
MMAVGFSRVLFRTLSELDYSSRHDAINDMSHMRRSLTLLRSRGFAFALDDFGSGCNSFQYLRELHFEYFKIDGAFIRNMLSSKIDLALVRNLSHLCKELGILTVGGSVESETIYAVLKDIGVDYAQGCHLGMPAPTMGGVLARVEPMAGDGRGSSGMVFVTTNVQPVVRLSTLVALGRRGAGGVSPSSSPARTSSGWTGSKLALAQCIATRMQLSALVDEKSKNSKHAPKKGVESLFAP